MKLSLFFSAIEGDVAAAFNKFQMMVLDVLTYIQKKTIVDSTTTGNLLSFSDPNGTVQDSGIPSANVVAGAVSGSSSSTSNDLCAFNGTTGKIIKDSSIPSANFPVSGTTAGNLSKYSNTTGAMADANYASSSLGLSTRQVLTSGTTYTRPVTCKWLRVRLWGGGGGGGGVANSGAGVVINGGGGAAGGYAELMITSPAASYSYALGSAGSAGSNTGGNGGNGGDTTFGTGPLAMAKGGTGGQGQTTLVGSTQVSQGGGPQTGGVGDIVGGGEMGEDGLSLGAYNSGGAGGSSFVGTGGLSTNTNSTGNAGAGFASGGSGASSFNAGGAKAGGAGTAGCIVVDEGY